MLQFQVNNTSSRRGATMIELMAMLAIVGLGLGSMFAVVTSGIYFSKDTEDTIKAINLAREWIEWVTSIRNTNWLRFSSDRTNCWKSDGYDSVCIGSDTLGDKIWSWSHILYTENGLWYLSGATTLNPQNNWANYSATYQTIQDSDWFFNQTGSTSLPTCNSTLQQQCRSIFTREIIISQPDPPNSDTLYITSIVYWNTKRLQKVELKTTLTNWKAKF